MLKLISGIILLFFVGLGYSDFIKSVLQSLFDAFLFYAYFIVSIFLISSGITEIKADTVIKTLNNEIKYTVVSKDNNLITKINLDE